MESAGHTLPLVIQVNNGLPDPAEAFQGPSGLREGFVVPELALKNPKTPGEKVGVAVDESTDFASSSVRVSQEFPSLPHGVSHVVVGNPRHLYFYGS